METSSSEAKSFSANAEKIIRIGCIGSAGTGRTTIAMKLASELGISFLRSANITDEILKRDGYDFSNGQCVEMFLSQSNRESEIIYKKIRIEKEHPSFVTDRTLLDNFAYILMNVSAYQVDVATKLNRMCRDHMSNYTHIVYFKRKEIIRNNNKRTVNKWFQMSVDFIIQGLIKEWNINTIIVDGDSEKETMEKILKEVRSCQ